MNNRRTLIIDTTCDHSTVASAHADAFNTLSQWRIQAPTLKGPTRAPSHPFPISFPSFYLPSLPPPLSPPLPSSSSREEEPQIQFGAAL